MTRGNTAVSNEVRSLSEDEDDLFTSVIPSKQINSSVQLVVPDLKLWFGAVRSGSWTNLSDCMRFISEYGYIVNSSPIWMERILSLISPTATPEQLEHILNGYADLYELLFYFIPLKDDYPTEASDIRTFGGTSTKTVQQERNRHLAFIVYHTDRSLFAPMYVMQSTNSVQTCFASEDERIMNSVSDAIRKWNDNIRQRFGTVVDQNNDSNTNDIEELSSSNGPEAQINLSHNSQTIHQPISHSNRQEMIMISEDSMTNDAQLSSGTDIVERVGINIISMTKSLDQARLMIQTMDSKSVETVDQQPVTNETLHEPELISQNVMMYMHQKRNRQDEETVRCSNNCSAQIPLVLFTNTTKTAIIPTANVQRNTGLENTYAPVRIKRQPKRCRRVRMLSDLAKKQCPLIQGGEGKSQRSYIELEVPDVDDKELYVGVRAVTENEHPHPLKAVAPENAETDLTSIESNERSCLRCDSGSFDSILERAFVSVTEEERKAHRKIIKVHLFNWKQYGPAVKEVIEKENLRLCKLEFHLCIQRNNDFYELVSPPSYSSVIEDTDGDVMIDPTMIEPKELCELGGEKITVPLNVHCAKKGFRIECNGNTLKNKDFTMDRKKLLLTSPARVDQIEDFHLIINRTEYVKDSSSQQERCLCDHYLRFVAHGQHTHHCLHSNHGAATEKK